MPNNEVKNALKECELHLRKCLANAASAGDYEAVKEITRIVTSVVSLAAGPAETSIQQRASRPKKQKNKRAKYPIFSRRGDELVKTGWSKKEKSTYDHKASKGVLALFAKRILEVTGVSGTFTAEMLFPLMDNGEEVPAYQGYLCLAWFKDLGIVNKDGRSGYRIDPAFTGEQQVWDSWNELQNHADLKGGR